MSSEKDDRTITLDLRGAAMMTQEEVISAYADLDSFQDRIRDEIGTLEDQRNNLRNALIKLAEKYDKPGTRERFEALWLEREQATDKILHLRKQIASHTPRRSDIAPFCQHTDRKGKSTFEQSLISSVSVCSLCKHARTS